MTTRAAALSYRLSTVVLLLASLLTALFGWLWAVNLDSLAQLNFGNRYTPLVLTVSGLIFVVVGWMITSRRPGNRVGWVTLGIGLPTVIGTLAVEYAIYSTVTDPGSLPHGDIAGWLGNFIWAVPVGLLAVVLVLVYPEGTLPSRRWRGVLVGAFLGMIGAMLFFALAPGPLASLPWIDNPLGLQSGDWTVWLSSGFFLLVATVPPAAWSMRRRYRRSRGVVRAQIKWFAAAAGMVAATYVGQFVFSVITGALDGGSPALRWFQTLSVAGFGLMGVAVGAAVLRYRLYDIDRIISRTLSYGLVVAVLGFVVLGVVSVLAIFVPSDDPLVVAVSTLFFFALFAPVSRRIHARVDRRFNRSRYESGQVVDAFAGTLQDQVDPASVIDDWIGVVSETMQPAAVGVWVKGSA